MNIFEKNYQKLLQLIPSLLEINTAAKLSSDGYMSLNLDILKRESKKLTIALSHYYKHPSGDMIADPDITIIVYIEAKMIEVLAYQDCFGYRRVYSDDMMAFSPSAKKELNSFLGQWLSNLLNQGHKIV